MTSASTTRRSAERPISFRAPGQLVATNDPIGERTISEGDLSYLAGFFDGEGCVMIRQRGQRWECALRIVNTNLPLLRHFKTITGGTLIIRGGAPGCRAHGELRLADGRAERWSRLLWPFVRIKRDEIDLLLAFRATIVRRGRAEVPLSVLQLRTDIIATCRMLKRRRFSV